MDVIEQFHFEGDHWTALKLQIQQEFARTTAVFNLTSVAFGRHKYFVLR